MQGDEKINQVVNEWVQKAENDLKSAAYLLKIGDECPRDSICFHAQQCVEKYLKAFLTLKGIDFPKTHDIEEILLLISENNRPKLTVSEQRRLTAYATVTRYPGNYELITFAEARKAVSMARRIRKEVRAFIPKKALRKRKKL